jgi:hypothetical protein
MPREIITGGYFNDNTRNNAQTTYGKSAVRLPILL